MERLYEILPQTRVSLNIFDIGSAALSDNPFSVLLSSDDARLISFDPQSKHWPAGAAENFDYILGDGETATFYSTRYPGCASIFEPDPDIIDQFATIGVAGKGNFAVTSKRTVQTKRLDDIAGLPRADFMKLDIQGAELVVLQNGVKTLTDTVVLEAEVEFVPLYRNQPLFGDLMSFLNGQGFLFHKLINVHGRTFRPFRLPNRFLPLSQVLWADAIFVRDFRAFPSLDPETLLRLAVVLHDQYKSYDLCFKALEALDDRRGADLAGRYRAHLQKRRLDRLFFNLVARPG